MKLPGATVSLIRTTAASRPQHRRVGAQPCDRIGDRPILSTPVWRSEKFSRGVHWFRVSCSSFEFVSSSMFIELSVAVGLVFGLDELETRNSKLETSFIGLW
jgi:hypothetical protein